MRVLNGVSVSPGVAIGTAVVIDAEGHRVSPRHIESAQIEAEVQRMREAFAVAARAARESQQAVADKLGRPISDILGAHAQLLEGPVVVQKSETLIRQHGWGAEYALNQVIGEIAQSLARLGPESRFGSRSADLFDIERQVLQHLMGQRREQLRSRQGPLIILATDLSPSETANLDPSQVQGLVTEGGGKASHTAIIAGALGLPAVVGIGPFLDEVTDGSLVIVDGQTGQVIIDPDEETLRKYQSRRDDFQNLEQKWLQLRDVPAITRDNHRISLLGNIEFPHEAQHCKARGAEGVGLYRTEFLYLGKTEDPTEEEHFEAYMQVVRELGPDRPVVIRTLDLGADKFQMASWKVEPERNPFLGVRSTRLCLRNLTLFKTQLRAILRASAFGNVRIMFPMISTLTEIRQCKMVLSEVQEDLHDAGVPFRERLPVGTMIEIPSAAIMADQLGKEVDFFSIGTNDLVQYTLAADRTNENLAQLYSPADPAVLRLIRMIVDAANRHNIEVNICGEMSGDRLYTLLLLGMGLRQLSLTPQHIPEIKSLIRSVTLTEAKRVAEEALRLESARDVLTYLREQNRRLVPEMFD
jgi:phosphotransferase system enzyme I (PtsI)